MSAYDGIDWAGQRQQAEASTRGMNRGPGVLSNYGAMATAHPDDVRASMYPQSGANFDPAFYLRTYPDVAASAFSANPLLHWQQFGQAEGRTPNARSAFDPAYYLGQNPDVAASPNFQGNPLLHWQQFGNDEGRAPNPRGNIASLLGMGFSSPGMSGRQGTGQAGSPFSAIDLSGGGGKQGPTSPGSAAPAPTPAPMPIPRALVAPAPAPADMSGYGGKVWPF